MLVRTVRSLKVIPGLKAADREVHLLTILFLKRLKSTRAFRYNVWKWLKKEYVKLIRFKLDLKSIIFLVGVRFLTDTPVLRGGSIRLLLIEPKPLSQRHIFLFSII